MIHRKLALLLTPAVLLGTLGFMAPQIIAQANSDTPDLHSNLLASTDSLKVASLINHGETEPSAHLLTRTALPDTPDTYFIEPRAGHSQLRTIIQVVPNPPAASK